MDDEKEIWCVLLYRSRTQRVYHWHWPRSSILECGKAAEFIKEHRK